MDATSLTKTKAMHFTTLRGIINRPELKLGNAVIPYTDNIKFLRSLWDSKLTWKGHITKLRNDCAKLTGMLKTITNQQWGSDQQCTTKIYQMYIRSKIEYGAPVYSSAARSTLVPLDSITTECLRIATEAFRTTPTETLHVLANEITPLHRRQFLSLKYYYKIKSNIANSAHPYLVPLYYRRLFKNKDIVMPLNQRVQDMLEKYKLRKHFIKPEFSYTLLSITQPTWTLKPVEVNFSLARYPKVITPQVEYIQEFRRECREEYRNKRKLYTDGSKRREGVGVAVVWDGGIRAATLPRDASIFSAELYTISMAVTVIKDLDGGHFVVMSDSSSVLKMLECGGNRHYICRRVKHDIAQLRKNGKNIFLLDS